MAPYKSDSSHVRFRRTSEPPFSPQMQIISSPLSASYASALHAVDSNPNMVKPRNRPPCIFRLLEFTGYDGRDVAGWLTHPDQTALHRHLGRTTQRLTAAGNGPDILGRLSSRSLTLRKSFVILLSVSHSRKNNSLSTISYAAGFSFIPPVPFPSCRANARESNETGSPSAAPIADRGSTESAIPAHHMFSLLARNYV